jgi:hypothetical protein
METSGWFGVRCLFRTDVAEEDAAYEERVTVWRAEDMDHAIRLAEAEALEYAAAIDAEYLGLAQCYTMADDLVFGAEVFSLIRTSPLGPREYLNAHFDTGTESQTHH